MLELREYQARAVHMLRERIEDRPILVMGTGAGKTTVAAQVIGRAVSKGSRVIFLVHRRELAFQAAARFRQFGLDVGVLLAGTDENRSAPVQVASIPTLIRREHWPADLVIVDECAHTTSASHKQCIDRYADAHLIGLTAVPVRLDGRGLGEVFGAIVEPITVSELIEKGYLVEPEVYAPPVDLGGLKIRLGDYAAPQLADRMNKIVGSIPGQWFKRAAGLRTVVFGVNVEHSKRITAAFVERDVRAEHLDGKATHADRAAILGRLASGDTTLVSSVMVLAEGWDLPALQCVVLARPTKSISLFRQQVGRVMRPPGPVIVLDHAGAHLEHGFVTDRIEWSLDGIKKNPTGAAPLRTCPLCYAIFAPGPTTCPACDAEMPVAVAAEKPEVEAKGELKRLRRKQKDDERAIYRSMLLRASEHGWKLGAARHEFKDRFGKWPRLFKLERECFVCPEHIWVQGKWGVSCQICRRSRSN